MSDRDISSSSNDLLDSDEINGLILISIANIIALVGSLMFFCCTSGTRKDYYEILDKVIPDFSKKAYEVLKDETETKKHVKIKHYTNTNNKPLYSASDLAKQHFSTRNDYEKVEL